MLRINKVSLNFLDPFHHFQDLFSDFYGAEER